MVPLNLCSFWDQTKSRFVEGLILDYFMMISFYNNCLLSVENRRKYNSLYLEVRLKFAVTKHYCSVGSSHVWHIVIVGPTSIYDREIGHIEHPFWEVRTPEQSLKMGNVG